MNNTLLKAPHDGTVAIVNDVTGGSDGAPSTSFLVQIVDLSTLEVQTLVNEVDIGRVAVGEGASFSVRAYGDRLFRGVVRTISPLGQRVSNAVNYMVLIDVDTQDREIANLLPGMTADVTIMTAERSNVLLVPVKAVTFARSAVGPSTGSHKSGLIDQQQAQDALAKAEQMLLDLQQANQDVLKNNPVPAFLLESRNNSILVKPVVLGLTNGTFYEVLAGLSIDDTVLVGEQDR